jgi:hypothetical protein
VALAAAMVEPGVVRFGLGPLTEVVAQHHTFAELAPHLDATVLPVVAQERVLRGEDLRDDARAEGAPDDPPLVLQPFERGYVLPDYRATERLDGAVPDPSEGGRAGWGVLGPRDIAGSDGAPRPPAAPTPAAPTPVPGPLVRALEDVVAPWSAQSGGELQVVTVAGSTDDALHALLDAAASIVHAPVVRGPVTTSEVLALIAHAGASGGVHGRRRGGAAGRSLAWWVARCATGLDRADTVDAEELEFRLEDVERIAFRTPGEAAWRLELALGAPDGVGDGHGEWAVAVAAFDRSQGPDDPEAAAPAPW